MKRFVEIAVLVVVMVVGTGCMAKKKAADKEFFTSGSREADQRAEQRMAKTDQLRGESSKGGIPILQQKKKPLYERLGGEAGIKGIVDDFVERVLADARVNWQRSDVKRTGVLGMGRKAVEWVPGEGNVAKLKLHLEQFIAVATGGPVKYEGRGMVEAHRGMGISNPEFDAAIGDLKATLDKLAVGVDEQKELLAIAESTRPEVVEKR